MLAFKGFFGSPTWTRTRDLRINSPSLYRLSYQGNEAAIISIEKNNATALFRFSALKTEKLYDIAAARRSHAFFRLSIEVANDILK